MKLNKTLVYFLIFTVIGALFTYNIVAKAYIVENMYDIDNLKS